VNFILWVTIPLTILADFDIINAMVKKTINSAIENGTIPVTLLPI
jgi:hypothetical protein